jgi:hypothetical protein
MINIQQPITDLNNSLQRLRREWDQVRLVWTDQVADHFENDSWHPLREQTERTLAKLRAVATVVDDAKRKVRDL